MSRPLRVALDARIISGHAAGVEQVVIGVAAALSSLDDGDEEFIFLTMPGQDHWLRPYLGRRCRIVNVRTTGAGGAWRRALGSTLDLLAPGGRERVHNVANRLRRRPGTLAPSVDIGFLEADVIHFLAPWGFLCDLPSLYNPYDLQHLHLPGFFSPRVIQEREASYRELCRRAVIVTAMTSWVRADLITHYGLPSGKVRVVPSPPIISLYPQPDGTRVAELKTKLGLKDSFVLYPAHTWPHKNHIRLLEALAMLRDRRQIRLDLVCCGRRTDFYGEIARRVEELNLTGQVSFLGFVEPEELRLLYDTAHCMVFPSLFEGWGLPIYDAFFSGLPVASSNACDLADRLGDAAVLFDPTDVGQIADALHTVWFDSATRRTLVEQGRRHVEVLSWERIGRTLRAFYREAAGRPLGTEDHELVESSRR